MFILVLKLYYLVHISYFVLQNLETCHHPYQNIINTRCKYYTIVYGFRNFLCCIKLCIKCKRNLINSKCMCIHKIDTQRKHFQECKQLQKYFDMYLCLICSQKYLEIFTVFYYTVFVLGAALSKFNTLITYVQPPYTE